MNIIRRACLAMLAILLLASTGWSWQPPAQPPAAQDGFVAANDLPQDEQLPAAPFVAGAYAFFLVLVVGYAWSISRRLSIVEREMRALDERQAREGGTR